MKTIAKNLRFHDYWEDAMACLGEVLRYSYEDGVKAGINFQVAINKTRKCLDRLEELTPEEKENSQKEQAMRINPGGLFRCCIRSMEIHEINNALPITEGSTLKCKYCQESMILEKNTWKWLKSSKEILVPQK